PCCYPVLSPFSVRPPPTSPLFPYTTLFRSVLGDVEMEVPHFDFLDCVRKFDILISLYFLPLYDEAYGNHVSEFRCDFTCLHTVLDRKSTRLNSSHVSISYAVFCLKKKNNTY